MASDHDTSQKVPPLSTLLPHILLGGAAFSAQMQSSPHSLPAKHLLDSAFSLGITAIDTSPYYGPSEEILGRALTDPEFSSKWPRETYFLSTKVGRVGGSCFDYSPDWVRGSVVRSLKRLGTSYLDLVFCHDVEFVSLDEMVEAVRCLLELKQEGKLRFVGISGYPPREILRRVKYLNRVFRGEKVVDAVQSYCHLTLQNSKLERYYGELVGELKDGGVVTNSSPLAMGLLRKGGAFGDWHPAPRGLREKCAVTLAEWCERKLGEKLANLALKYSVGRAAGLHRGVSLIGGGRGRAEGGGNDNSNSSEEVSKRSRRCNGYTIMGPSLPEELEENFKVLEEIMVDPAPGGEDKRKLRPIDEGKVMDLESAFQQAKMVLGEEWVGYSWESPPKDWETIREPNRQVISVDNPPALKSKL